MKRTVRDHGCSFSTLGDLLAPISTGGFFADHWDREALFIDNDSRAFEPLCSLDAFREVIHEIKLGEPEFRYINPSMGSEPECLDYFLRVKARWTQPPSLEDLADTLAAGVLNVTRIEQRLPGLKQFCRRLFPDLNASMLINAFCTARAGASAFGAHFDSADVLVVQMEGEREWRFWERERVINASNYQVNHPKSPPGQPADHTVLMRPGDVLYLPRGSWHDPVAVNDDLALHLTVTILPLRPADILDWLRGRVTHESAFYASLPSSPHAVGSPLEDEGLTRLINHLHDLISDKQMLRKAYQEMLVKAMGNLR
ncbi:MAG: JmjC domain-containing protein [Gammaproteobacteria bacterium]